MELMTHRLVTYTCGGQKSDGQTPKLPRIPSNAPSSPYPPVWTTSSHHQKLPKSPFFLFLHRKSWPPGGWLKKRQHHFLSGYMLITYTCGGQKSNGCAYIRVFFRRFWKKLKRKKTHNSRKKLNNSAEKLKDLTKFTERRKKLKYFCCKNTFYQKSITFSYKKLCCLQ